MKLELATEALLSRLNLAQKDLNAQRGEVAHQKEILAKVEAELEVVLARYNKINEEINYIKELNERS